ncbi:hypothetical protein MMC17_004869 [Xylographa soralifera]|nr:hypothetical protein [Xylographa soralifera]
MTATYVPPSALKSRLMTALGLQSGNPSHEAVYLAVKVRLCQFDLLQHMLTFSKAECATAYEATCGNRANLRPEFLRVVDKFTYNQMKESAIDNAIVQIYRNAQPNVRAWYDSWGVDGTSSNFIIRWFLYHLFRNRDARNDRKAKSMDFHADDDDEDSE